MAMDLKDNFLQSTLKYPQCIQIHGKHLFEEIRAKYHIEYIVENYGYIYCKIVK